VKLLVKGTTGCEVKKLFDKPQHLYSLCVIIPVLHAIRV